MSRNLTVILTFVVLTSCSNSSSNQTYLEFTNSNYLGASISLIKQDDIILSTPDSVYLAAPDYTIETDHKGDRMAIFDAMTSQFLIFNKEGKYLQSIGRDGKGPEEFMMVFSYTFDNEGNLIVYDDGLKRLKIFDSEYNLIRTSEIKNDQYYLASHKIFANDDKIITGILETEYSGPVNRNEVTNSNIAGVFSYNMEKSNFLGKYDPYLNEIVPSTNRPVIHVDGQYLYTSHSNSYRIQVFDTSNGNRISYFGFRSENFGHLEEEIAPRESLEERFRKGFEESSTRMIHTDEKYLYFYFINGTEEWMEAKDLSTLNYHLMIYNKKTLDFLGEINLPYRLSHAKNNNFYLLEDENPDNFTYGVYEVVIE